ncbi:ATP-binding protein [Streptomyces fungicidicus]|jgi:hypothetical protein|uniref:ATP-binding protein n=2 Tax=Streptomyces TaxID=1883 RepID=A0A494UT55_9ACTN|nr:MULTISPECIES: hypothetical protein [Streptomyces]AYL38063.1 ATP-binding protein [Streptomyces fungicidicus]QKW02452.1 ATP-binding protein [Streptomyces sp. NA02536]TQL20366.1 hypothetical protein FBY37_2321 [Streptomyces sp. SLBN-134]
MSLPLTRRIARAALLVAAGAAAGVGAAGSASAAPELPATPNLGGVSALDGAAGNTVDDVAKTPVTPGKVAPAAGETVKEAAGALAQNAPVKGLPVG